MGITTDNFPNKALINNSYSELFKYVSDNINKEEIKVIFEFGTGYSTCLLSELFSESKIISIECDTEWYNKYYTIFKDFKNVDMIKYDALNMLNNTDTVINDLISIYGKPQIVFIDSENREGIYNIFSSLLNKPDILLMHDANWFFDIEELKSIKGLQVGNLAKLDYSLWKYFIIDSLFLDIKDTATIFLSDKYNLMVV